MDAARIAQLIRQRALAKASFSRMQTFTEAGDPKVNEIQVIYQAFLTDKTLHRMNWNYQMTQTILPIENYLKTNTTKSR